MILSFYYIRVPDSTFVAAAQASALASSSGFLLVDLLAANA